MPHGDEKFGWRLRVGMLLPSSNRVAEPEIPQMLADGISLHTTRLRLVGSTREQLMGMTERIEEGAALLADADADIIAFHCTAVSTYDPALEVEIKRRLEVATGRPATATSEALIEGLREFGARRLVLISPYITEINAREAAFFRHHQFEVLHEVGLGLTDAAAFAAVSPGDWYRLTMRNRRPEADAYVISCTAVRSSQVIDELERDLGKPVITSNQALAWRVMRQSGIRDTVRGFGTLLAEH